MMFVMWQIKTSLLSERVSYVLYLNPLDQILPVHVLLYDSFTDFIFSGGKRSFEEALKPEDDTEESPLKQLCLTKGDCDLLIDVTAPSFLMDTISVPNETFHQASDITLKTTRVVSPIKNQSSVELTVKKKVFLEDSELNDTSVCFVQKRIVDDICEKSFSLRVDISTDHDGSKIVVEEDERNNISVEIDEHLKRIPETADYSALQTSTKTVGEKRVSTAQCTTVQESCSSPESPIRFVPMHSKMKSKSKSIGNALYNKYKEPTIGTEDHLRLRHSMALPKLASISQQKEMDILRYVTQTTS